MTRSVSRARRIWARLLTILAVIIALPSVALTIARYIPFASAPTTGDRWALVTAGTDLAVIGYAVALPIALIALIVRLSSSRIVLMVIIIAMTALHLSWIVPRYRGDERPPVNGLRVRVLTQNMDRGGADLAQVTTHAEQADVVVLTELTIPPRNELRKSAWHQRFPYEQRGFLTPLSGGGTRVFSRWPITGIQRRGGDLNLQIWLITVAVPDLGDLDIIATHLGSPKVDGQYWLTGLDTLRAAVPPRGLCMIVGDLSAVDSQAPLRRLRADGFRSSTELAGAGWQPTYPSNRSFPALFEIDHVLLGPGLTATDSTTLPTAGTDHRAVLATVAPA